ncbi:DUF6256 family protein [Streptomyces sp. NPDC006368]|uniref:DUF6256 family protein n=1 Tax=Streptomyces sp. NPDC006368 TaxID=3156760 RepID=UPI0033ACF390
MLPVGLNVAIMLTGYLLVMAYLALGLRIRRRGPAVWPPPNATRRRGWPGLFRQVAGTAIGGYALLMAVVLAYYQGVAHLGGHFLASAFTGAATLVGVTLPVFFLVSAAVIAVRRIRSRRRGTPHR